MHEASLQQKVISPNLPPILLHRKALITQLQKTIIPDHLQEGACTRYKLLLCCAPAGYGKTTLLADFARTLSIPCCWYFLDQTDSDPIVFLRTLLTSIHQTFPSFTFSSFPEPSLLTANSYYAIIDALCNAIATEIPERFLLMLCNYEEINESKVLTELLNYLLKKLPDQFTLVIESRVIPDFSFASLVIHDEVCGLHKDALRFSPQEIIELASLQGLPPLTLAEAEQLATSYEGWITGILLGTRIGNARFQPVQGPTMSGEVPTIPREYLLVKHKQQTLLAYIDDAVLKHDQKAYDFLQSIAILQQVEPSICNALLALDDAAEQLARLERRGLFLTSYEDVSGTITYSLHSVIRDLWSTQLSIQEPERFLALHRHAAIHWQASNNSEQALYHALQAGDYDMANLLIAENAESLLQRGQGETLLRWLHTLPMTVQEGHPLPLVLEAAILLERGQHTYAFPQLERAEALLPSLNEVEVQKKLELLIPVLRSKALSQIGQYARAQELCQQVLTSIPEQDRTLRATVTIRLGVCASLQGDFASGIEYLQHALQIWDHQPPPNQAIDIHSALANTYYFTGNLSLAQYHLSIMIDAAEQIQDISEKVRALNLRGLIAQDQGQPSESEAAFLQVLDFTSDTSDMKRGKAYALVNLSLLYVEQGQYTQALTYAHNGLALARQFGNRSLVNAALSSQALSYLFLDDAVSALFMVEQMDAQPTSAGSIGYEQAWRDLTYGLVLLKQGNSFKAAASLAEIEGTLRSSSLKRELLQAKMRLAASHVEQGHSAQAVQLLNEVVTILSTHHIYIHQTQVELQWLPALLPLVQNHPHLALLRSQLNIAEPLPPQKLPQPTTVELELTKTSSDEQTSPATLTIYAFGEPTVLLHGEPIKKWRMDRAKELFFFLLDAPHPVSKEAILTALWPEYDEQTNQTFHNTVYYLRKLLGKDCLLCQPSGYSLNLASVYGGQVWYDAHAFEQQRNQAEQALAREEYTSAKTAFLIMIQIYRGDYGRAFYSDWCTVRRDELRNHYLDARRQLAQLALNAEAWSESAEHWREMLKLDNCLEEAHYGLMRCYLRQGQRGTALRQYQLCQQLLQEELGVKPGPVMQHLYQRLTSN